MSSSSWRGVTEESRSTRFRAAGLAGRASGGGEKIPKNLQEVASLVTPSWNQIRDFLSDLEGVRSLEEWTVGHTSLREQEFGS